MTKISRPLILIAMLLFPSMGFRAQEVPPSIAEKDHVAYLFAYFTGNGPGQEQIHFAVSTDGLNYRALNSNRPIIDSRKISTSGGVRDPHILRGIDGKTYYMVATDLYVPKMGWSNYAIILMKSTDLIQWKSTVVNVPETYPKSFGKVHRVWAPQTIYDHQAGKYMIYFSMKQGSDPDVIYYAYANSDFTGFEAAPRQLYYPPAESNTRACIDGDIVYKDGKFHLFYKAEDGDPGIKLAVSDRLTCGYSLHSNRRIDRSRNPVEGSCIFKLNNRNEWILMYDVYTRGRYQFTTSTDLVKFEVIDQKVSMDFHPRHGTILPITRNELKVVTKHWGLPKGFDAINGNPILPGYYADPEIIYSHKNKKFYLYPTSDGFTGWSGTSFKTFSSEDLLDWTDEGVILDLKNDVEWSDRNAWAPCCIEKRRGNDYKYYYYYTATQRIGVAVANDPTGPFKDIGKPLIDKKPSGIRGGQEIDPAVFHDPVSGKDYLYWGNGYMSVVELNEDMVSYKPESMKVITPDRTYREGTCVFYRKGIYYFLWSEDDTRSPNYRVRYGTSESPTGPISIPQNNIVIAKDPQQGIYGTGHNTIIKVPGTDQWYIVYHRFNYPNGIKMGRAAGYHREVCIDPLKFDEHGVILRTKPTHHGIADRPAADVTVTVQADVPAKPISSDLFGIFFEDLNYAADGGLYPERIQNRSFEYSRGDNREWNSLTSWELLQSIPGTVEAAVKTEHPLNKNNPHYAVLKVNKAGGRNGLSNEGFDGIAVNAGDEYNVSLFARILSGNLKAVTVRVESPKGGSIGEVKLSGLQKEWTKHTALFKAKANETHARLVVLVSGTGELGLDMVSLFPRKTFKNRPNGLRPDLAQVIADLKPKFLRFPGGCLAHGDGLENMYRWKDTIGPLEQRKAQRNIWRYHQTLGLGYFEYFQFCEDIGAEPLPVVPAGVCCQNSGNHLNLVPRGQRGIPMDEMEEYVQEVLDLIEYANGPVTSEWGSKRAAAGHHAPFNMKYLGVGNEDVISTVFKERYKMINDAIKERHPDIIVIGTTGPFTDGRDYEEGWKFAREEKLPMVDEHGYKPPAWFWDNLDRFDAYERTGTKVYLGEYAAHEGNRANTLRSALAEAAYMTSLERNGDLVRLVSYAPLLSKQGRTQWRPDLIYFDNVSITLSVNYYVQKLFSHNQGDFYLPTNVKNRHTDRHVSLTSGPPNGVLLGTWNTQATFDNVRIISDTKSVLDETFGRDTDQWQELSGQWRLSDGAYHQMTNDTPALSMFSAITDKSGYTLNLKAKKTGGAEGFLIGFGVIDTQNYYWLNLGGWNNTQHAIEKTSGGVKSIIGQPVKGRINTDHWYDVKVEVVNGRIRCYLDGRLIFNLMDRGFTRAPDLAISTVRDSATGDVIVKLVSKSDTMTRATLDLSSIGPFNSTMKLTVLSSGPLAQNRFGLSPEVLPRVTEVEVSDIFDYEIPPCSLSILRINTN